MQQKTIIKNIAISLHDTIIDEIVEYLNSDSDNPKVETTEYEYKFITKIKKELIEMLSKDCR